MTREEFMDNLTQVAENEEKEIPGVPINDEMWDAITTVYMYHPSIDATKGKYEIASIYLNFGMAVIQDMVKRAKKARELEEEMHRLNRKKQNLTEKIERMKTGADIEQEYYFTFGSSENFPYQNGYLIVMAESEYEAIEKFREIYPDKNKDTVNCSDICLEAEWRKFKSKHYEGRKPFEIIC